jgi:alpha-tubulin suppressor-like RCC1 family protein
MFSLIITVITIALVAVLALATLYYGGAAFTQSSAAATAGKLINQGQQLIGAAELFRVENGRWPASVQEMVMSSYLRSVPVAKSAVSAALAENSWEMPKAGVPVFISQHPASGPCRQVNEKAYGLDGILIQAQPDLIYQCYGSAEETLTVLVGRSRSDLLDVAETVPATNPYLRPENVSQVFSVPTSGSDPAWLLAPGSANAAGPVGPVVPAAGDMALDVLSLNFGTALAPTATNTSTSLSVVASNTSSDTTALSSPVFENAADFSLLSSTCGASLPAGGSCIYTLSYAPVSAGTVTGRFWVHSSAANSPRQVLLNGTAYNPVTLGAATLPAATVNQDYLPYDFKTLLSVGNESTPDRSQASWTLAGTLPLGMSFSGTSGELSGRPSATTSAAGADFTVTGTYRSNQGQQVYTIRVGEAILSATKISSSSLRACAITTDGEVKCWGWNGGWLGTGSTAAQTLTPELVLGLPAGVVDVKLGGSHICAITAAGGVRCWGNNFWGQLGDGTNAASTTPVPVAGLASGVSSLALGDNFSCARTSAGEAKCWGQNASGQLAQGDYVSHGGAVVTARLLTEGVVGIAAGARHACALLTTGGVRCWGENWRGQLGDNNSYQSAGWPRNVFGFATGVASIAAGNEGSCLVTTDGAAHCWGDNRGRQVGDGLTAQNLLRPWPVSTLNTGVQSISVGATHVCAVLSTGALKCWGGNINGQVGIGTNTAIEGYPRDVTGLLSGVLSVAASDRFTCATLAAGGVRCWGIGHFGVLGNNSTAGSNVPTAVVP